MKEIRMIIINTIIVGMYNGNRIVVRLNNCTINGEEQITTLKYTYSKNGATVQGARTTAGGVVQMLGDITDKKVVKSNKIVRVNGKDVA